MKPRLMWLLCLVAAAAMALAGGSGFTPALWPRRSSAARSLSAPPARSTTCSNATWTSGCSARTTARWRPTSCRCPTRSRSGNSHARLGRSVLDGKSADSGARTDRYRVLQRRVHPHSEAEHGAKHRDRRGRRRAPRPHRLGRGDRRNRRRRAVARTGHLPVDARALLQSRVGLQGRLRARRLPDDARGSRGDDDAPAHRLVPRATLVAAVALAAVAEPLGALYAVVGVAVGALFLWMVVRLHYEQTEDAAFRAFHASNAYLGLLLFAVVFDALVV